MKVRFNEELLVKIKSIHNPLICIGDWNCLWFKEDKRGGERIPLINLDRARNILDEGNLIDLGHSGLHFTWINRISDNRIILERLDRGAADPNWKLMFPNAYIENYIMDGSDHSPIIFDTFLEAPFYPRPFRFEWMWTLHVGYKDQIGKGWHKKSDGQNLETVRGNLLRLPPILKNWNNGVFGKIKEILKLVKLSLEISTWF